MKILDKEQLVLSDQKPRIVVGKVTQKLPGDNFVLESQEATHEAICAISCIVEPEVDDVVTYFLCEGERCYILAILQRSSSNALKISTDRDLTMVSNGTLRVSSHQGVDLSSDAAINLRSKAILMQAETVDLLWNRVKLLGNSLETVFRSVTQTAETMVQNAQMLFRNTKDMESVQSGSFSQRVSGFSVSECDYGAILAKQDMRIDGERIHVG